MNDKAIEARIENLALDRNYNIEIQVKALEIYGLLKMAEAIGKCKLIDFKES